MAILWLASMIFGYFSLCLNYNSYERTSHGTLLPPLLLLFFIFHFHFHFYFHFQSHLLFSFIFIDLYVYLGRTGAYDSGSYEHDQNWEKLYW